MPETDKPDWPTLKQLVSRYLTRVLESVGWNQTRAAAVLGISPRVLNYRMKALGIPRPHDGTVHHHGRPRTKKEPAP